MRVSHGASISVQRYDGSRLTFHAFRCFCGKDAGLACGAASAASNATPLFMALCCSACHAPGFRLRTHRIHTPELPRRSVDQKLSSRACRRILSITGKRRNRLASDTVIDAATFSDVSVLHAMRPELWIHACLVDVPEFWLYMFHVEAPMSIGKTPVEGLTSHACRCFPMHSGRIKAGWRGTACSVANTSAHSRGDSVLHPLSD